MRQFSFVMKKYTKEIKIIRKLFQFKEIYIKTLFP